MANKIRENLEDWLRWYEEGSATKEEVHNRINEYNDLIFRMWQNDLISNKVKNECYEVTKEFAWNFIKKCHS